MWKRLVLSSLFLSTRLLAQICPPLSSVTIGVAGSTTICPTGTGGTATVTDVGGGVCHHQWAYRPMGTATYEPIPGANGGTYDLNGSDFPSTGFFYLVCNTVPTCGSYRQSNDLEIVVSEPTAPAVTPPLATEIPTSTCARSDGFVPKIKIIHVSGTDPCGGGIGPGGQGCTTDFEANQNEMLYAEAIDPMTGTLDTNPAASWDFGAGSSPPNLTGSPSGQFRYTTTGLKTVTLNGYGLPVTASGNIKAVSPLTVSVNAFPSSAGVGQSISFTCAPSGGVLPYTSYSWNFGDQQTSSTQNPWHVYQAAGSYTATCSVTDAASTTRTGSVHISVN